MIKQLWRWVLLPLILIAIGAVIVVYTVNNPTDSLVARALTYKTSLKSPAATLTLMIVSMAGAIVFGVWLG
jgi:hypothetical protein